jgi:hypothetical protein
LLPPGTWERLKATGFKVREAQALLNLRSAHQEPENVFPLRYQRLAVTAFQLEDLTEVQLARFLRTDIIGAREVVERLEAPVIVTDDGVVERLSLDLGEAVGQTG